MSALVFVPNFAFLRELCAFAVNTFFFKIACIAEAHDATLLTRNTVDFAQVPGLRFENWLDWNGLFRILSHPTFKVGSSPGHLFMPKRKDITIRFCLDRGEGEQIEASLFSEDELADVRTCLSLDLTYIPATISPHRIISVQIIHDGITPVEDEIEGYFIDRECDYPLDGYPTPIVRFLLDRAMDEQEFLRCVFETSFCVRTKLMEENDEEPYFAEDHNGYSSVLTTKQSKRLVNVLRCHGAYCGKIYEFPAGLPESGYSIPALDFALKATNG